MAEAIGGWFISLSPAEEKELKATLEESGYSPDVSGLKQMILDGLQEDREEEPRGRADDVIDHIAGFIRENPETIRQYGRFAGSILSGLIKKKPGHSPRPAS